MSKLREAAQAALNQWDKVSGVFRMTAETEALRAALAEPETAEPVAWQTFDGEGGYDYRDFYQNEDYELEWKRLNPAYADWVTPLYAHPPRDGWRPASEPPDTPPHDYLLKKLAMVMPLFEEARDALTAISEQQRAVRCISPTLADRMDAAGTYSIDDWRDVTPPTEGER